MIAIRYKKPWKRRRRYFGSIQRLLAGVIVLSLMGLFLSLSGPIRSMDGRVNDVVERIADQANSLIGTVSASKLTGRASVIDGDTLEIHSERVRLHGIDAPESDQLCQDSRGKNYRCGAISAKALDKLVSASQPISCDFMERDQYDRFVGNCYGPDQVNLAASMVRSGYALDWPRHSGGLYAEENAAAKAERIGVWQGDFVQPWDWRAQERDAAPQNNTAPVSLFEVPGAADDCNIKGNISNKGERIYHVPGQKFYGKTKISEGKGERWFCSESEARSAGWRRAMR